jgi:hypothetical protein
LRQQACAQVWLHRFFGLPFLVAGIIMLLNVFQCPLTRTFGVDGSGRIVGVQPCLRGEDSHRLDVTFTYDAGRQIREKWHGEIDTGGRAPPRPGESISIRTIAVGAFHNAELRDGKCDACGLAFTGLFAVLWYGFFMHFTAMAWLGSISNRRLPRNGNVTVGTVNGKKQRKGGRSGRVIYYDVLYQFRASDGTAHSGSAEVEHDMFERLNVGTSISVFYHPCKPSRSCLYEATDFEIYSDSSS